MQLRHAFRKLAGSPGFTAIAVLTLALGIGINTVVFTLYEGVALKPIAARSPGELVRISGSQDGQRLDSFTFTQYQQVRSQSRSFTDVVATTAPQTIVGRVSGAALGQPEVLRVRLVSSNYFAALGVAARIGRGFQMNDRAVAVASYDFWANKLDSDPAVLGRSIRVRGTALDVVGVAPKNFAGTGLPPQMPDLWIPLAAQPEVLPGLDWLHSDTAREWQVLARRRRDVSVEQASAELEVLARNWPPVHGKAAHLAARRATFFQTDSGEFETFGDICAVLMVSVGLILLIGSINLVNLLFARHAMREHEFAVRLALGASRLQLVRQLCTESALLGVLGGSAGLLLSLWSCEWIRLQLAEFLRRISAGGLSLYLDLSPDWRVLAYTAAVSLFAGIAVGVWPAMQASRRDVISALKQTSAGSAGGNRSAWSKRNLLLSAQLAACLILLVGAGLLFRGVWQSAKVDPGFPVDRLAGIVIDTHVLAPTEAGSVRLLHQAVDRIEALPEVASVAWADRFPFLGHGTGGFVNEHGARVRCLDNVVSNRYFETLGLPLLAGRDFTIEEMESRAHVVVISDLAARQAWPGQDPIGRQIHELDWVDRGKTRPEESFTVIGVVKSVRSTYLSKPDEAFLYLPRPLGGASGSLLVRTRTAPDRALRSAFGALSSIDPSLPSQASMFTMTDGPVKIQRMMAQAPATVAVILGSLALVLASVGILGLVSQLVTRRTREIAIRVSLGAQERAVIGLVLWQTLRPVILGAGAGLAGAVGLSALLASMVAIPEMPDLTYGAGAFSPATFIGALAVLLMVILAASCLPLYRAARIEPAEALRNE